MKRCALLLVLLWIASARSHAAAPVHGTVSVNGVRLEYIDWGGSGLPLIGVHGLASSPHTFDGLAPAFTGRFHVVTYARRGSGGSDARGPYDRVTLTNDLRGLMDALGFARAILVGASAGGDEITEMAGRFPDRVSQLVYLDAGYDWSDSRFKAAVEALPRGFFDPPAQARQSLAAFRAYEAQGRPRGVDPAVTEAVLRDRVIIHQDGTVSLRTPKPVIEALYAALWSNPPRDYTLVRAPALAIYADTLYNLEGTDARRRQELAAYEARYWKPFQRASIERIERELAHVKVVRMPGAHGSFFMTQQERVVQVILQFLDRSTVP